MATGSDLLLNHELPLTLEPGKVIAFKSAMFFDCDLVGKSCLELFNQQNDTLLSITLHRPRIGKHEIVFNDRAGIRLVDGWGNEKSVDLNPLDVERWQRSGVTVSVHCYSAHPLEQYQILFDLTTVFIFDKNFFGPATKVAYYQILGPSILSNPLIAYTYKLDDLPLTERKAMDSGRVRLAIPAPISAMTFPSSNFVPNRPRALACISWDNGKEMRIYHLGPGNVLQEYFYSAKKNRGNWHHGSLGVTLDPASSLTAIRCKDDIIRIYYRDLKSDIILILSQCGYIWDSEVQTTNTRAAKSSDIAVAEYSDANGLFHSRIYYQDPELCLRELIYDRSTHQWLPGDFNAGMQPRGTPITAEGVCGRAVDLNVMWRDAHRRAVSNSWSQRSGWNTGTEQALDGHY